MTSPERCQAVFYEQVTNTTFDALQLLDTKQYDLALKTYHQALKYAALLSNPEQREYTIANIFRDDRFTFLPLTQLPRQLQEQWIAWLQQVQEYMLSLGANASLGIAQTLKQLAKGYKIFKRTDLQQATLAAEKIPEPMNQVNEFIQLATIWLQFQNKATTEQLLIQALAANEQIQTDNPYDQWNYLRSIASLYIQVGLPQQALTLAAKIASEYIADSIRQEVVNDAVKRGQIHFAQAIATQIPRAEYQAKSLVAIAVYWATHNQTRRANRLFAQALQRVAKEENAQILQSTLIQAYTKSGQLTIALNAAQPLTENEAKTLALGEIAVAYSRLQQTQQAQKVLVQLKDFIQSEAAVNPVGYVTNVLRSAVDAQQYDFAMAILNTVHNDMEFYSKPTWYREIIQPQLRSHRLNKALQLAKQIPNDVYPEERNTYLQEIAIAYANAKKWHRAWEVAAQMRNTISTPYQVLIRTELAAIAPTPEQFTTQIQIAIAQTQTLEPKNQKALALAAIAQAYLRSGDAAQTEYFLQQAIQTAQQVEDYIGLNGNMIAAITDYLIQKRQYSAALTVAQANTVSYLQQSSYNSILELSLACYAFDVALQLVDLSSLPETQATQLLAIAKIYAQLGREDAVLLLDRAFEVAQKIADPETRTIQVSEYTEVDDESDRAHQYTRLVKLYVAIGQPDKAQQVIEKTQSASLRDYLQAWISC